MNPSPLQKTVAALLLILTAPVLLVSGFVAIFGIAIGWIFIFPFKYATSALPLPPDRRQYLLLLIPNLILASAAAASGLMAASAPTAVATNDTLYLTLGIAVVCHITATVSFNTLFARVAAPPRSWLTFQLRMLLFYAPLLLFSLAVNGSK